MSETEYIQLKFEDITAPIDEGVKREYRESLKGNMQIAEEEPKAKGKSSAFLKFKKGETKILHFPHIKPNGEPNNGDTMGKGPIYKIFIEEIPEKNLTYKTLEEFEADERYVNRKDKDRKPSLRYYVHVNEITVDGTIPATWDMAKTKYLQVFREFDKYEKLKQNIRTLEIEAPKVATDPLKISPVSDEDLKALLQQQKPAKK